MMILTACQTYTPSLMRALERLRRLALVVRVFGPGEARTGEEYDLIAIDIAGGAGEGMAWGIRLLSRQPSSEIVFLCEDADVPEVAAACALGTRRLVVGPSACDWLAAAAPILVRAARARRALRKVEAAVPPVPSVPQEISWAQPLPLPVAEERFRESYVRALLACTGSRVHAARQAGIPYRTLCRILQTAAIVPTAPPSQR